MGYKELTGPAANSFLAHLKKSKSGDEVRVCIQHFGCALALHTPNTLQELCTGVGKTKLALDAADKCKGHWLVIHKMVAHKTNLQLEIAKWKKQNPEYLKGVKFTFSTYVGLKKFAGTQFTGIIADEAHNFTPASLAVLRGIKRERLVMLTASLPLEKRKLIHSEFSFETFKVTLQQAQQWGVLPVIKFLVVPIYDVQVPAAFTIERLQIEADLKTAIALKGKLEREGKESGWVINTKILPLGLKRKHVYSKIKARVLFTNAFLRQMEKYRTVFFVDTIQQAGCIPGHKAVHSKMTRSEIEQTIEQFNLGKLGNIAAVNMLNESMNLWKLHIGLLLSLGRTNEVANIQRVGRMTRGEDPLMILPYLVGTADEKVANAFIKTTQSYEIVSVGNLISKIVEHANKYGFKKSARR